MGRASLRDVSSVWPIVFALPVVVVVAGYHLVASEYHCDDLTWLKATENGLLAGFVSPHPFGHFRPSFYVWFWLLRSLGLSSPAGLGVAGVLLQLALLALVYLFLRSWLPVRASAVATAVFAVHPVRQSHWFWASTQIDALCLVFIVASLLAASRALSLGLSWSRLLHLAGLTLLASLSKETAFALPVAIALLPPTRPVRTRIIVAGVSALAVVAAIVWSTAVLGSAGRAGDLVSHADLSALARYPVQLVMPTHWFGLSNMRVGTAGYKIVWRASWLAGLGLAVVFAIVLWRFRASKWAKLSVVFIGWAGFAWAASRTDRSIGIGALGIAILFGGLTESWRRWSPVAALMLALCLAWAPRWFVYLTQWRAADRHTAELSEELAEERRAWATTQHFVVVGLPYTIGEMAEPAAVYELDECASAATMVLHASPELRGATSRLAYPNLALEVQPPATFGGCDDNLFVGLQPLPQTVIASRQCDEVGMLRGFSIDVEGLVREAQHPTCGGAIPLLWTGSDLVPLEK